MTISDRDISKEELHRIYDDFKKIEYEYGIPDANTKRHNTTVEENDEIIGFASGLTNHKWFYLSNLWINEKYRNQGLGAKILNMLEEKVKLLGIDHIYTWTTGYNMNTMFYKKQGYKKFTILENFYEVENGHQIGYRKDFR